MHKIVGFALAVTVGNGFTVIIKVDVVEQPLLSPVSVYVVVRVGLTTTLLPVRVPGSQV